jgi:hypothetical protein
MAPYVLIFIAAGAIPFLLYCLWHFIRETEPHSSPRRLSVESFRMHAVQAKRMAHLSVNRVRGRNTCVAARRPQVECQFPAKSEGLTHPGEPEVR